MAGLGTGIIDAPSLQTAIAAYTKRGDTATMLPIWLGLAEDRINRDLRVMDMVTIVNPYVVSAEFQTVPSDFVGIKRIRLLDSPAWDLEFLQPDQMAKRVSENNGVQAPYLTSYGIEGGKFWFNPVPGQSWNCELAYYAQIPTLATANTNWLLTQRSDIYLFAILREAYDFYEDDAQLQKYDQRLTDAIRNANSADRKKTQAFNITPQPARPQVF